MSAHAKMPRMRKITTREIVKKIQSRTFEEKVTQTEIEILNSVVDSIMKSVGGMLVPALSGVKELVEPQRISGTLLRGARTKVGLSQLEVCSRLNIKQANLSALENNKRPLGEELAKKFGKLYKIDYRLLLKKKV